MKLVLIGGGNYGTYPDQPYNLKEIDEKIAGLTGKAHPRLLFIGFTIKSNHTFGFMKKHYMNIGVQCEHLCFNEFSNNKTVEGKFKRADIIYIGGGNTISFMQKLKKFALDIKLKEAAQQNKVIAGRSAGAIIISSSGSSDSRHYKNGKMYTCVKGLGLLDVFLAPHYMDSDRPKDIKNVLRKKENIIAVGLDSCSALVVDGEKFETVSSKENAEAYKIYLQAGNIVHEKLEKHGKLCDLLSKQ